MNQNNSQPSRPVTDALAMALGFISAVLFTAPAFDFSLSYFMTQAEPLLNWVGYELSGYLWLLCVFIGIWTLTRFSVVVILTGLNNLKTYLLVRLSLSRRHY